MGLRIVDGQIVVFDRNGLVRLVDRDGNDFKVTKLDNVRFVPFQRGIMK